MDRTRDSGNKMIEKRKSADYKKGFCEGYQEGRRETIDSILFSVASSGILWAIALVLLWIFGHC